MVRRSLGPATGARMKTTLLLTFALATTALPAARLAFAVPLPRQAPKLAFAVPLPRQIGAVAFAVPLPRNAGNFAFAVPLPRQTGTTA